MSDLENSISSLTDRQAVAAVSAIVEKWFEKEGLQAHLFVEEVKEKTRENNLNFPKELYIDKSESDVNLTAENGKYAKLLLHQLSQADDATIRDWTRNEIQKAERATAQVIESIIIAKSILALGFIFVSRVKRIDRHGIEFHELKKGDIPAIIGLATAILVA